MQGATREHWGVPFHEHAQIEIVESSPARGRARIPALAALTNHTGNVHGAMLYAVGEVTAAACMVGVLGDHLLKLRGVTRRGEIDYLKPARGEVTGEAHAAMNLDQILAGLERSRSVDVPIDVILQGTDGTTVAKLAMTWFVGRPKAPKSG